MSSQTWTPAPKRGAIPLHPMTFGMLLGRAFSALRHNPKVLFGFAVVIQIASLLIVTGVMVGVLFVSVTRLSTVPPSSPDFPAIAAGTVGVNLLAGIALSFATVALTAMLQGVIAADVSFAAVGRKAPLGLLWRRMRPAFWRLACWALIQAAAVFGAIAIVVGIMVAIAAGGGFDNEAFIGLAVLIIVLIVLACIPLAVWLTTKLLLVPSILVLERARIRVALVRSWRLTRGRFWVAFGVTVLIGLIMGLATQVVSIPASFASMLLTGVLVPTASPEPSAIIAMALTTLLPQILVLAVQAVGVVVQCTGATLIYVDSRMRYEGLDQTLIAYTERSTLGWTDEQLGDPYAVDPARAVGSTPPAPPVPQYAGQPYGAQSSGGQPYAGQPYGAQSYAGQPYGGQPYGAQSYGAQSYGAQQDPGPWPAQPPQGSPPQAPYPPYATTPSAPPAAPPAPAPTPPAATPIPPASDSPWAPPGGGE